MSLLALLAAAGSSTPLDPDPWEPPEPFPVTVPGVPTSAPWHMTDPITIQGYNHPVHGYSTDQTLHPTVVDFGGKWNGYRFWMVHTPYPAAGTHPDGKVGEHFEDPCLSASNDCLTWVPIVHPMYISTSFHSDPEMRWNPDAARLELWIRDGGSGRVHAQMHAHAAIPADWPGLAVGVPILDVPEQSACVVRFDDGQWRMWTRVDGDLSFRTATSAEGPWSTRTLCGVNGTTGPSDVAMWHPGIVHLAGDTLLGLHDSSTGGIYTFRSDDRGQTWTWAAAATISGTAASTWARTSTYRPTMVLHENGTHVRVWYSSSSDAHGWRMGYTELPLETWDDIGPA